MAGVLRARSTHGRQVEGAQVEPARAPHGFALEQLRRRQVVNVIEALAMLALHVTVPRLRAMLGAL